MPVFFLLIILGAIVLWFLCAGAYKYIGRLFSRIGRDAIKEMSQIDDEKKENY